MLWLSLAVCGALRAPSGHAPPLLRRVARPRVAPPAPLAVALAPALGAHLAPVAAARASVAMQSTNSSDSPPPQQKKPRRRGGWFARLYSPLVFLAAFAVTFALHLTWRSSGSSISRVGYSEAVLEIKRGGVRRAQFSPTERELWMQTVKDETQRVAIIPAVHPQLVDLLTARNVPFSVMPVPDENPLAQFLAGVALPLLLFWALFLRVGSGGSSSSSGGGNPLSMLSQLRKAQSELRITPDTGVTFADVAGCDGSKLELREIVDFLKRPGKFVALGARAPRGVLLEGPPGTGKTLLARAVAGEAGVPFISASGSEFVEMFVGVGASRIRDLFERAKGAAPCIIFIDEIDAIGKARGGGAGMGGGNDEREQTLNQILTEMDGFDKATGVVVLAATNRADVLDPALLRPGRFDRRVPVDLPDRAGRLAILKVHARDKPLGTDVELASVAARTTGFSGAALANLLNEAAIVTARRDKSEITMAEVEYALDRLTVGLEQRTGMASDARKRLVAYHEAGHAIMGALTPQFDLIGKVTIVPRSNGAGGFTLFVPSDERQDSGLYSRRYLDGQLAVALGGRVAEELVYGRDEVTTGASSDLQRVADVARKMVTQWGFAADSLGSTAWELPMGTGFNTPKMASEATQQRIDEQVEKIVRKAYETCRDTLSQNRALLDRLVEQLVERETVNADELTAMVTELAVPVRQPPPPGI